MRNVSSITFYVSYHHDLLTELSVKINPNQNVTHTTGAHTLEPGTFLKGYIKLPKTVMLYIRLFVVAFHYFDTLGSTDTLLSYPTVMTSPLALLYLRH